MTKIKRGYTIRLVKPMGAFKNVGELCQVTEVDDSAIFFRFGKVHLGCISFDEFDKYFELVGTVQPISTKDRVDALLRNATIYERVVFDKCLIIAIKLENGYVLAESVASEKTESFNYEAGKDYCISKIRNRLIQMENYRNASQELDSKRMGVVDH